MYVFILRRTAPTWRDVFRGRKFENKNANMKIKLQNDKDSPSHSGSHAPGIVTCWFFWGEVGGWRIYQRLAQSRSWRTVPCMLSATVYSVSYIPYWMGRDSPVYITIRYGLDGPGIESSWVARFSATVQTGPGAHPVSSTMCTKSFSGVKRPGRSVDHPPTQRRG